MRKLLHICYFFLFTLNVMFGQSETYTCPNGASVTATANSFTSSGPTSCTVNVTISSTIFNASQRLNYVGLGNPSFNSNLFNGNFGESYPSTTSNTGNIIINLACANVDMGAIEVRQSSLTGTLCGSLALPVELTDFTAKVEGKTIRLFWETSSEIDNAGFDIERSGDGIVFESIGTVAGHGTTFINQQYLFVDEQPFQGVNYYRLRQVDNDGFETLHLVIAVIFETQNHSQIFTIFPTLALSKLQFLLKEELDAPGELYISTVLGQIVLNRTLARGERQVPLDVQKLPKGQYLLTLKSGEIIQTAQFLKQ